MDGPSTTTATLDQADEEVTATLDKTDEEVLTTTVSDEALEAVARAEMGAQSVATGLYCCYTSTPITGC
jgi:hypothetical protein